MKQARPTTVVGQKDYIEHLKSINKTLQKQNDEILKLLDKITIMDKRHDVHFRKICKEKANAIQPFIIDLF